jgi:RecA-family ATPase
MADITAAGLAAHLASLGDADEVNKFLRQARMLAAANADSEAFEPPIRTLGDYLAAEIEVPPVLIHPLMCVRGGLNVTVGRAGKGKTVMNLNRMLRWSAGLPMFDGWVDGDGNALLAPDEPLKILIVENEGAAGMFHRQVGLMLHAEDYLPKEQRALVKENTLVWGEGGYSHLKLDDPAKLDGLRRGCEKWKPDLVFIEPFRSLWSGEENSSTEMNVVVDALVGIGTDYNCGVWAAHHEKKGGHGEDDKMSAARGSTVLEGIVTLMENFESTKGGDLRELSWSKSRYEVPPPPVRMEWDHEAKWYKHVPAEAIEDEIMAALADNNDEPMSVADLSEALDETKTKIRDVCKKMKKDDKIKALPSVATQNGSTGARYRLPSGENAAFGGIDL